MTRRGGLLPVAWAGGVAFLAVFAGLALQVRGGSDPVLGAGRGESAAVAPRRVLLRRVIQRRVIVRVVPAPLEPASGSAPVTTTGPVASSTPPVSSAPAPAPATPPTTRSS
jgi:hypothetical protein